MEHMLWIGHKSCHCSFSRARQLRSYWRTGGDRVGLDVGGRAAHSGGSALHLLTHLHNLRSRLHTSEASCLHPAACVGPEHGHTRSTHGITLDACTYASLWPQSSASWVERQTTRCRCVPASCSWGGSPPAHMYAHTHKHTCTAANGEEGFCEFM